MTIVPAITLAPDWNPDRGFAIDELVYESARKSSWQPFASASTRQECLAHVAAKLAERFAEAWNLDPRAPRDSAAPRKDTMTLHYAVCECGGERFWVRREPLVRGTTVTMTDRLVCADCNTPYDGPERLSKSAPKPAGRR